MIDSRDENVGVEKFFRRKLQQAKAYVCDKEKIFKSLCACAAAGKWG